MRKLALILVLLAPVLSFAGHEESLEQLKARAEAARPADQPGLFLNIADRQLQNANEAFTAGNTEQGQQAVAEVVSYAERAGEAARVSGKHLKHTEIHVRKIAQRLDDIRRTLNFEDRAPLQQASDRLEHVRAELLTRMFEHK